MNPKRWLLVVLVTLAAGCGVTQWQREQDAKAEILDSAKALNSGTLDRQIRCAVHCEGREECLKCGDVR